MPVFLSKWINAGADGAPDVDEARRIRLVNLICLCSIGLNIIYIAAYLWMGWYVRMGIASAFIACYTAGPMLNRRGLTRDAPRWLLLVGLLPRPVQT